LDESNHGVISSPPIVEPGSSSPSAPESPILRATDVEMKEDESKTAQNENEDMQVMKNTVHSINNVSQDIGKVASCAVEVEYSEAQNSFNFAIPCAETSMEMEPCSSASIFSENKMKKSMEKWVPIKWMPKIAVNKETYVEHIMASFLGELRLARNDILIQPCSFTYPDYLTQQLGLNQYIHCMNMDFLADIITRYSVQDLSRWRTCLVCRPRLLEDETIRAQLGGTLNATSSALGRFVQSISSSDSNQMVQQLLTFCLDFETGLICKIFYNLIFFPHANSDA
ncbi:unnamed protein product, partial [Onchocerca flexuosa]|uniref:SP-RING-type domain-containing protein n=1 Tax=Onchocerca flexuosa TaxID=387005 RepID=A0A183HF04_9BILA